MSAFLTGNITNVKASQISDDAIDSIKAATDSGEKHFPQFVVHIKDSKNQIVAEVNRTVYIRKKAKYRPL